MNNVKIKIITPLLLMFSVGSYSQTKEDIEVIKKSTNIRVLKQLNERFFTETEASLEKALKLAKEKGWKIKGVDKYGSHFKVVGVSKDNQPIYYKTDNANASKSTRANTLNTGGLLGLNVNGENMTARVWDGGHARVSHNEYKEGSSSKSRVSIGDKGSKLSNHSGHVMGTILATGVKVQIKGMAFKAKGISYDWNHDVSEATEAAQQAMLLSNHSYGYRANSIPDEYFGAYRNRSREWDLIMNNAPFYLMVCSAGNDGSNDEANEEPLDNQTRFDKLSGFKTSKNNLVVANFQDAVVGAQGNLISATRHPSSSEGPTDDYRIKPDIAGNGTRVYSTGAKNNNQYLSMTGTSMASPNVMGTLLLLQEHYRTVNKVFMRASTLKGLALHTADDLGMEGPDATSGWGYLNAKFAAETITENGTKSTIQEYSIKNGETNTLMVNAIPNEDLKISISWTDPAGTAVTELNSKTPVLVNDLDLTVSKSGKKYLPWKLAGVTTNEKGDNDVDPYERVDIKNANGQYTVSIKHENNLLNNFQNYSLIVTGGVIVDSGDCLETLNISQDVASGNTDNQQASKTIKVTNRIAPNAKAVYNAGDVVILKPGFHAKSGSSFRAFIEGCKKQNNINATSNAFVEYDYAPTSENSHDLEEFNSNTDNALTIYPNPSDDGIFNIRSTIKIAYYLVVDFVGNPVLKSQDNKEISRIDLSKYPAGLYILKIQTENGKRIDYKLIKK